MKDIDITKNISIIESLKSQSLFQIAELFQNDPQTIAGTNKENTISDLIITLYLLADKMGYSHSKIDANIDKRLKIAIQGEDSSWREELLILKRHLGV